MKLRCWWSCLTFCGLWLIYNLGGDLAVLYTLLALSAAFSMRRCCAALKPRTVSAVRSTVSSVHIWTVAHNICSPPTIVIEALPIRLRRDVPHVSVRGPIFFLLYTADLTVLNCWAMDIGFIRISADEAHVCDLCNPDDNVDLQIIIASDRFGDVAD